MEQDCLRWLDGIGEHPLGASGQRYNRRSSIGLPGVVFPAGRPGIDWPFTASDHERTRKPA